MRDEERSWPGFIPKHLGRGYCPTNLLAESELIEGWCEKDWSHTEVLFAVVRDKAGHAWVWVGDMDDRLGEHVERLMSPENFEIEYGDGRLDEGDVARASGLARALNEADELSSGVAGGGEGGVEKSSRGRL